MKIILPLLVILVSGCQNLEHTLDQSIPDGKAQHMQATVTGKFSATQITAENFVKTPDKVTADEIHMRHSNIYVPLIEIDLKGYERVRK